MSNKKMKKGYVVSYHQEDISLPSVTVSGSARMTDAVNHREYVTDYGNFTMDLMAYDDDNHDGNVGFYYLGLIIQDSKIISRFSTPFKVSNSSVVRIAYAGGESKFQVHCLGNVMCEFELPKDEWEEKLDAVAAEFIKEVMADDTMEPTGLSQSSDLMDLAKELVEMNFSHPSLDPTLNDRVCPNTEIEE